MSTESVSTLSPIIHALSCTCRTNPAFNKTWWLEVSAEFDDWCFVAGINLLDNLLRPYVALLDLLASLLALSYSHLRKSNVWIVVRVVAGLVTWLSKRKRKRAKKFNQPPVTIKSTCGDWPIGWIIYNSDRRMLEILQKAFAFKCCNKNPNNHHCVLLNFWLLL